MERCDPSVLLSVGPLVGLISTISAKITFGPSMCECAKEIKKERKHKLQKVDFDSPGCP